MARKSRKLRAKSARTVFYVAMEGSVTERKYFDAVIKEYNLRNVHLLKRPKTRSSPHDVLKRLEKEISKRKDDHGIALDERYWAVFDIDSRPIEMFRSVAARAARKKIILAASNPCFELWLLLHFGSLSQLSGLEGSAASGGCDRVIDYLRRRFDKDYDKSSFNPSKYVEKINAAICNGKASDSSDDDAWMNSVVSRVYQLVESIVNSAPSPNNPRD